MGHFAQIPGIIESIFRSAFGWQEAAAGTMGYSISQALTKYEPALRAPVKAAGFLTRDSRAVERKKYGKAKARKSFQFSKR